MKLDRNFQTDRKAGLENMYKRAFPALAKFIAKRGGSFEQARDVFHDALVIWYEKLEGRPNWSTEEDLKYLMGIAKNLWYREFSAEQAKQPLPETESWMLEAEESERPSDSSLLAVLEASGKRCLELLKSFYYDKLTMTELAETFGFKTERSATVQKYKCLEKVRQTVKDKSLKYEDFLEGH
ncbi:RNA polymerase sigma factor [Pedobacter sp. SYSU D00535]|uniref:RNA polymerase sigma factor n=1 Tax=Pedobacter sp. SYSU D00535 TaxID=2810308 RepID=UPI001A966FAB|nr:sigma-70 family RNA polymerase sigma factor [Pedobacter sp. SYSU D00535]